MQRRVGAKISKRRLRPALNDGDWKHVADMFGGGGFYLVRTFGGHFVELRNLTAADWRYVAEMLSRNGYHLSRTHEKHLVELRRVASPLPAELGEFVMKLSQEVVEEEEEVK